MASTGGGGGGGGGLRMYPILQLNYDSFIDSDSEVECLTSI